MRSERASTGARIRPITAEETRGLRASVLRPGQAPRELIYPGDEVAGTRHLGAFAGGELVGIASFYTEPLASAPDAKAVRLRGMATAPAVRGRGHGVALMAAGTDWARAAGADLIWCNARSSARGFYEKLGLRTEGEEFELAGIGPHWVMVRFLGSEHR